MEPSQSGQFKAKKKRVRNWTAEDRAVHREFEKSRREAFSERLTELTSLLPNLKSEQRPSKHVIVDASIAYHKTQEARSHQAARVIQDLISERDDILREANTLRSLCQCQASEFVPRQARPIDPAVVAMLTDKGPTVSTGEQIGMVSHTATDQAIPLSSSAVIPPSIQTSHFSLQVPPLPQPTYNADDWPWPQPSQAKGPDTSIPFPPTSIGDSPETWNAQSSMVTATVTPPKDVELACDPGASLIDNSAFFWTQHPSLNTTTPPRDTDIHYGANAAALAQGVPLIWSQSMAIPATTPSSGEESSPNNQISQSNNLFASTGNLSI